jgi:hypothetical protein
MRVVALAFLGLALSCPATAAPQDTSRPASRVIERTDISHDAMPWRLVQATSQSGDRETTREIEETPNTDGRMVPVRETVIEVIKAGTIVRTTAETFGVGLSGQRVPLATRESIEEQPGVGRMRTTSTVRHPDLNGRLAIGERITDETLVTPEGRRMERTIDRPDQNGQLRPMERTEHVENVAPQQVRSTTTAWRTDVNNRWQVIEVRNLDARTIGATENVEETIRQSDLNGALWDRQRTVSRVTRQNGREDVVVEMFDQERSAFGSTTRPSMSGRIHRTITPRADGGRELVEQVEERSLVAPDDPLRIVRRVVETTWRTGAGGWETERQLFERDPNNRLILTTFETEATRDR